MTDEFEGSFTLNRALTEEDWAKIADYEMKDTKCVTFCTPSGREAKYVSIEVLQEIKDEIEKMPCGKFTVMNSGQYYFNLGKDAAIKVIDRKIKEYTE